MKKIILLFSLVLFNQNLRSQIVFCPQGAEWSYAFVTWNNIFNEKIFYHRDSLLGSESVKVLRHWRFWRNNNLAPGLKETLIQQRGDTVFFRNTVTSHNWQVLYNFAAQPGEFWTNNILQYQNTPNPNVSQTYVVYVDSLKTVTINSVPLKRLFVRYSAPLYEESVVITERFGCDKFLFNFTNQAWVTDADYLYYNLCYKDNSFGTQQFTSQPCDLKGYLSLKDNSLANSGIKLYPNPARDRVRIEIENELLARDCSAQIYDLSGRCVKEMDAEILQQGLSIDIKDLNSGIYMLQLKGKDGEVWTGKLVVER